MDEEHSEPLPVAPSPAPPPPPSALESFLVLGVMAVAAFSCWILYAPMIRQMALYLRHQWLGH